MKWVPAMEWTRETPTRDGVYWLRTKPAYLKGETYTRIVELDTWDESHPSLRTMGWEERASMPTPDEQPEWCGPLLPPD